MKHLIFTLVLCTLFLFSSSTFSNTSSKPLKFQLADTYYELNREWTKIELSASGGVPPYQYFIDEYPQVWKQYDQYLFVMKESYSYNRKYPCKVRVQDDKGNQAKATIIVQVIGKKVSVSQTIYPYDMKFSDDFFNTGVFSGRPKLVKSGNFDENTQTINMNSYDGFIPFDQLSFDKQRINAINLGAITNSYGTGLDAYFGYNGQFDGGSSSNGYNGFYPTDYYNYGSSNSPSKSNIGASFSSGYTSNSNTKINQNPFFDWTNGFVDIFSSGAGSTNIFNVTNNNKKTNNFVPSIPSTPTNTLIPSFPSNPNTFIPSLPNNFINTFIPSFPNTPTTYSLPSFPNISNNNIFNPSIKDSSNLVGSNQISLPSSKQIDDLILSADSVAISKVIRNVNSTKSFSCEQKTIYLNNLLARIQSAISMKKFAADQLKTISSSASLETRNLTIQIEEKKKQISSLNVTSLKSKLNIDLQSLEKLYSQFNSADSQSIQEQISSIKTEISTQKTKSDVNRQQIVRQKLSLTQADAYIKNLQKQINDAKARKSILEVSIQKNEGSIKLSSEKTKINEEKVAKLQRQLDLLENKSDQLKIAYQVLQSTISRYRTDVSRGVASQDEYYAQISRLQEKLSIQKSKIVTDQLQKLKEMVATLNQNFPKIESVIDSNYYSCYRASNLTTEVVGSTTVYLIPIKNLQAYLQSSYLIKIDPKSLNFPVSQIRLTPINILDQAWQTSIGQPYDIVQYASSKEFSFAEDFNCLNPSSLISGVGVISKINSRYFTIDNLKGGSLILNLGTCSRIETNQLLPTVGQRVYWRGVPGSLNNSYNIYRASCI